MIDRATSVDDALRSMPDADRISVELSSRRTGMSFQRTRMSADRTLMSVIRTSLSLIGFGFTIAQFFHWLKESNALPAGLAGGRPFGVSLVFLGIGMLVVGIGYHVVFMRGLRREREAMAGEGLIHAESVYPVSLTLIIAILLTVLGVGTVAALLFDVGPFG
jgi:putative membrane protein